MRMRNRAIGITAFRWLTALMAAALIAASGVESDASPRRYLNETDAWYASDEARRIAENVLSHQSEWGGWPKNIDTTEPFEGDRASIQPTFDNGATADEMRFLMRFYNATGDERVLQAFLRGLDHILEAQYPSGGWPQRYPVGDSYHRHITFNDQAMTRLMEFLREVAQSEVYDSLDRQRREAAMDAFERGVECVLRCQIEVDGRLTAWCAQHDEVDLSPRPGRSYELESISGAESVGVVRLLMSLDDPSLEVRRAIHAAVAWFESVKLEGIRLETREVPDAPRGRDRFVVEDPDAPPMWARFYKIETFRPLFVDRDGVPMYRLEDIGHERRNGYAWLGRWPSTLIERDYPEWKAKWGE